MGVWFLGTEVGYCIILIIIDAGPDEDKRYVLSDPLDSVLSKIGLDNPSFILIQL